MQHPANASETEYQYTPQQVASLLGVTPATVRSHASHLAAKGQPLGQLQAKAGGGFVRLYSAADIAYLRTIGRKWKGMQHGR